MRAIYKRELRSYLTSMTGYIFMAVLLAVAGLYYTANCLVGGYPVFGVILSSIYFVLLIVVPVLIIIGVPVFDYAAQMLDPALIVVLVMLGLTFGYCYVTWYKSFALIGVGRGQSLGTLCGLFSCVFLLVFCGQEQDWTLWLGILICVVGSFLLVSEDPSTMDSIRGSSEGE